MTVHETPVGATVEWFTPPELFEALGLTYDLDPAAPEWPAADWVPARHRFAQSGEDLPWHGRVWLNPPYGPLLPQFMHRMATHRNGVALTAARTETRWWQAAAASADVVCFLRDRLHFIRADGFQARSSFASTLFAWGAEPSAALLSANLGWTIDRALGDRGHASSADVCSRVANLRAPIERVA